MQPFRAAVGGLLLVMSGCGAKTPAVATRVFDPDSAGIANSPVCFVPPSPQLGLTERAQMGQIVQICEGAARQQGVPIVAWGQGQCLAATLSWSARDTGARSGDCVNTWGGGAECYSTGVHIKYLKVALAPAAGKVVAETTASVRSAHNDFTRESFRALCSAAFHDFPQPLSSERFEVSVE
jgi:hypothetical protein